jgi:2-methylisocitrate lyase-like PEP mutase family enzyme
MDKNTLVARAERLAELHSQGHPLVLPTVWDSWSAKTAVKAGFAALTIGSHPLADSRGAQDHEGQSFPEVVEAAGRIILAADAPVSVDLESGYGQDPADLIAGLLEAGGVGLNVEDTLHLEGGRVRSTDEHASYIAGLRAAADAAGVPVWINGRTDLFMHAGDKAGRTAVADEAIERMQALVAAGADSVYPVFIQDDDDLITAVVAAVDAPVNCTAHPTRHSVGRFAQLGVGRVTYGPLLQAALTDAMTEMITPWRE